MLVETPRQRSLESGCHRWRLLVIGLAFSLLLSACGDTADAPGEIGASSTSETAMAAAEASAETPSVEAEPTTAPELAMAVQPTAAPEPPAAPVGEEPEEVGSIAPIWETGASHLTVPAGTVRLPVMGGLQMTFEEPHFVRQNPEFHLILGSSTIPASVEIAKVAARTDGTPIKTTEELRAALRDLEGGIELVELGTTQYPIGEAVHLRQTRQSTEPTEDGLSPIPDPTASSPYWGAPAVAELWIFETERGLMMVTAESFVDDTYLDDRVALAESLLPTLAFVDPSQSADPLGFEACGQGTECATFEVPVDYDNPDGETTEISVVRHPARGERIGTLFVNPVGPGRSVQKLVEGFGYFGPPEITERFDLVGVDPRGTGNSGPLDCTADWEQTVAVCDDTHGVAYLASITTENAARDIESIRVAIGAEPLTFLGISSGTAIASAYSALFPDNVRSMVQAVPTNPAEYGIGGGPRFQEALLRLVSGGTR